jgi:broad specificity phosphatase PhoE
MGFAGEPASGDRASNGFARLILVRHGQASLGSDDYDRLSERGHRQARLTAGRLSEVLQLGTKTWTGTLRRHRETVAPLQALVEPALKRTEDLNEFSTAGLVRAALRDADALAIPKPRRAHLLDPVAHLPDLLEWFPEVLVAWQERGMVDAEIGSWGQFHERVTRARSEWEATAREGSDVVVVSSAGVIATLAASLAGHDLAWQRALAVRLYNASVTELAYESDGWTLLRCNCTEHLDAEGLRTLA